MDDLQNKDSNTKSVTLLEEDSVIMEIPKVNIVLVNQESMFKKPTGALQMRINQVIAAELV